jgi:flavin reductase (DIM6/NTAB) family NADH-FMN oxidoreductase RutF
MDTDSRRLRHILGTFATGVTVVTVGGQVPHGMTANSFTAVSLDPPLVLVCVERQAIMHAALTETGLFGISVLASHQELVARHFADHRRPLGKAQFQVVDWFPGPHSGAPLIAEAVAHLECALHQVYDGGDHSIFLGRLLSTERRSDANALVFLHGRFRRLDRERTEIPT